MNTLKVLRSPALLCLSIVRISIHKPPTQLGFPHWLNINLLQAKPNVEGILIQNSQKSKALQGAVPPPLKSIKVVLIHFAIFIQVHSKNKPK